jgi:molybdopterin/thiamine biosynthesis adenylyltransferase
MLDDAAIERWSRQILLPEVGGTGQELLNAAHVVVVGSGPAAALARILVQRAGPQLVDDEGDAAVLVDVSDDPVTRARLAEHALTTGIPLVCGRGAGTVGAVATLVGRPCGHCWDPAPPSAATPSADASASGALTSVAPMALGALVAAEVLYALLLEPGMGRVQHLDLVAGTFAGPLEANGGCLRCGGDA